MVRVDSSVDSSLPIVAAATSVVQTTTTVDIEASADEGKTPCVKHGAKGLGGEE